MINRIVILAIIGLSILSCKQKTTEQHKTKQEVTTDKTEKEFLVSWNQGDVKSAIIDFVETTTDKKNKDFIAIKDRIAVFDNDGTLWSEKPFYFEGIFAMDRIKELVSQHPEWEKQQPYKAVLEEDIETLKTLQISDLIKIIDVSHSGVSTREFKVIVDNWFETAKHPTLNKPYNELVYQPMLELITYLKANDFKVFIVSGFGIDFIRNFGEEAYGIPRDQIVGTSFNTAYKVIEEVPRIIRVKGINFFNDNEGKPIGIERFIGRKPVFCVGNSDGDKAMMDWTAADNQKNFKLYIHHTDSIREFAYDRHSVSGKFDVALDEARLKKWNIVDMKEDWKVIYPFELDK